MKLKEYLNEIESFIKDYLESNHMDMIVLGLSGGVDSSLVAALTRRAVGKDRLMCIMMPIESHPSDLEDAIEVAKALDVNYIVVDGSDTFKAAKEAFLKTGVEFDKATLSNLKVRIRMSYLFAYAQKSHGLVIGTDNMDERYTGYFTKYGDGAADLLPIVYLTKGEVVEAAEMLGVPSRLAKRTPTAGLFAGQTDEGEMGVKYADLDKYLLGGEIDEASKARIEHLHRISEHKRVPIPTPKEYERD
ncbi:MAG: NAD(+) synthase [Bacilli bacterium]|nr:NAD(+) synthase [Bacilli bacterium]